MEVPWWGAENSTQLWLALRGNPRGRQPKLGDTRPVRPNASGGNQMPLSIGRGEVGGTTISATGTRPAERRKRGGETTQSESPLE